MMEDLKSKSTPPCKTGNERGFTLVEIIIAMVLIGIAVPTIMIPFSGLEDTKNPEYIVQASFMAQKRLEELANQKRTEILTACPDGTTASATPENGYEMDCTSVDVSATDPDSSATSDFAKKITLTVRRTDSAMSSLEFTALFANDG